MHTQLTAAGLARVETVERDAIERQTAVFAGFSAGELAQLRHPSLPLGERSNRNQAGPLCQS